jgi:uncharacterized protein YjgD (DUF1641 family)
MVETERPLTGGSAPAGAALGTMDRLAEVAERAAATVDLLASPEVFELLVQVRQSAPSLARTVQRVDELTKSGAMDSLLNLAQVLEAAQKSMGDPMVARIGNLVRVLGEMGDLLISSGLPEKAPVVMEAVAAARTDAEADQSVVGVFGLMKALKQPEIQFALKFVLALARRLPAAE